jgi:hypothetical protein
MNKHSLAALAVCALLGAPAFAQKVTVDYARGYDFDQVKTFTIVSPAESPTGNQLTDDRIVSAIARKLKEGGLQQVPTGGNILVTFHVTTEDNVVFNTTSYGYGGWGAGWGRWGGYGGYGGGSSTTTAQTYVEGTLIVDAYEPAEKKLVWRGTGTVTVKENPDKRTKQIDAILEKMGARWQKILAEQGK